MNKQDKRAIIALIGFCILFIILIIYLSAFQIFKSASLKKNPYNKRLWANEDKVLRGSILDRNGNILAYSNREEGKNERIYNYGNLYSHIIGYSYREYGKAGLEHEYNNVLLDVKNSETYNDIKNIVLPSSTGNDLVLTIDHGMQEKTRKLLTGHKGAIVTMNPTTGEIYSMVSMPDFDTNMLNDNWQSIIENKDSPFLNRATQGLYTPGSTFKIVTTAAFLDNGVNEENLNYTCKGNTVIDGYKISDYGGIAHGNVDLKRAFINSCNTFYAEKISNISQNQFIETAEKFMINKDIKFDLNVKNSVFKRDENMQSTKLSASAIGQGDLLLTPLNLAMISSSIANNGRMMKPFLVKEIKNSKGSIIKDYKSEELSQVLSFEDAQKIQEMMRGVVSEGTGKSASIKNVKVAGKTGTAENSSNKTHSLFVGYAPYDNPKIAVAVVLEEEGLTGGKAAAPIARDLLIYGLNNITFEEW